MAGPTLDDLYRAFANAPHPHLVEEMRLDPGGVDPLGLRQVNLNLMDASLPGINNVTDRVRPYAFMAWAWWKAARAAEAPGGRAIAVSDLQDVVENLAGEPPRESKHSGSVQSVPVRSHPGGLGAIFGKPSGRFRGYFGPVPAGLQAPSKRRRLPSNSTARAPR